MKKKNIPDNPGDRHRRHSGATHSFKKLGLFIKRQGCSGMDINKREEPFFGRGGNDHFGGVKSAAAISPPESSTTSVPSDRNFESVSSNCDHHGMDSDHGGRNSDAAVAARGSAGGRPNLVSYLLAQQQQERQRLQREQEELLSSVHSKTLKNLLATLPPSPQSPSSYLTRNTVPMTSRESSAASPPSALRYDVKDQHQLHGAASRGVGTISINGSSDDVAANNINNDNNYYNSMGAGAARRIQFVNKNRKRSLDQYCHLEGRSEIEEEIAHALLMSKRQRLISTNTTLVPRSTMMGTTSTASQELLTTTAGVNSSLGKGDRLPLSLSSLDTSALQVRRGGEGEAGFLPSLSTTTSSSPPLLYDPYLMLLRRRIAEQDQQQQHLHAALTASSKIYREQQLMASVEAEMRSLNSFQNRNFYNNIEDHAIFCNPSLLHLNNDLSSASLPLLLQIMRNGDMIPSSSSSSTTQDTTRTNFFNEGFSASSFISSNPMLYNREYCQYVSGAKLRDSYNLCLNNTEKSFSKPERKLDGDSADILNHGKDHFSKRPYMHLGTDNDEIWLSKFLCFLRLKCIEVFEATQTDVVERKTSKKIEINQVGLRCRFCAHAPYRSRVLRSSCFPSSISRIYQSLTMMIREHFSRCTEMPEGIRKKYSDLKHLTKKGEIESKTHWMESARSIGMVDTDKGIYLAKALVLTYPDFDNRSACEKKNIKSDHECKG